MLNNINGFRNFFGKALLFFSAFIFSMFLSLADEPEVKTAHNEDSEEGNEIKNCTPKKLYRGDTFEIIFAKKHGGKMLVYREPRENFYFLDTLSPDEEGGFPKLTEAEIEKSLSLQLNTETTRKTNFRKTDSSDNYVVDRVFNKTGWYRVVIGHQSLDVNFIDMPVTGSCRVYYINKKRPHGK